MMILLPLTIAALMALGSFAVAGDARNHRRRREDRDRIIAESERRYRETGDVRCLEERRG